MTMATGTYFTVPQEQVGGGVWSSVAATKTAVFATTASASKSTGGFPFSIVRVNAATMQGEDHWTIPAAERVPDSDFGGSPSWSPLR